MTIVTEPTTADLARQIDELRLGPDLQLGNGAPKIAQTPGHDTMRVDLRG